MTGIQDYIIAFTNILSDLILPFIVTLAFFFFIWNAFRYFIVGGANPDDQEKAKSLAIWGVLAFVVIVGLWGMVNILTDMLNVEDNTPVNVDYINEKS